MFPKKRIGEGSCPSSEYLSCVLLVAAVRLAPTVTLAQTPGNFTGYASKLNGPRGLKFGPDGDLYVAEAGTGGTNSTRRHLPASAGYLCLLVRTKEARRRGSHGSTASGTRYDGGLGISFHAGCSRAISSE